jgi:hypothetical protein
MNDDDQQPINLQYARPGPYITQLSEAPEQAFQQWVKKNNVPFDSSTKADYDMRGFWVALMSGDPRATTATSQDDGQIHYPDTWKTPYHKTFSNESIYATHAAPKWVGYKLIDYYGRVIADETPKVNSGLMNKTNNKK